MMHGTDVHDLQSDRKAVSPLLRLIGIDKSFPGVHALRDVSLDVHAGEVHVILGQNGAGKSTLIKTLYGAHAADRGAIEVEGRAVAIARPADARALGIAVIFQEFSLVPYLDIAQNIYLGHEAAFSRYGLIDSAAMHAAARSILDDLGLDYDTRTDAADLGVAQQQMVEIAKALSQNARVLVMDEPTAAISERESERLFATIARLTPRGVAIVYISHRMKEVQMLGDRITILRDGAVVTSILRGEMSQTGMVDAMIGRASGAQVARTPRPAGQPILFARGISTAKLSDISIEIHAGEVVGLAGLVGSGRTEVVRALFGADAITSGEIALLGTPAPTTLDARVRAGMALLPEDRKQEGVALPLDIRANATVASLWRSFASGWFSPATAERDTSRLIAQLGIAAHGPRQTVRTLSGGNQQKVVLAKWLAAGAKLFLLDEPTRGVDVGAKAEIYRLIDQLVDGGAGVVVISSELPELVQLCDRAYVMRDQRIVGHLDGDALTERAILELAVHQ
jgi:ribose transport system ATP-binding protein